MTDYVLIDEKDAVLTVTLNRGETHNAMDEVLIADLTKAVQSIKSSVRAVIFRGSGQSFCAGADLNYMRRMGDFSALENKQDALKLAYLFKAIYDLPMPTLAFVHGAAYGGGVGLSSACDFVIGCDTSLFCLSEVKLGLVPATIFPYLIDKMGIAKIRHAALSAERFQGRSALDVGLLTHYEMTQDKAEERLSFLIDLIKKGGAHAQKTVKILARDLHGADMIDDKIIDHTAQVIADIRGHDEAKEGLSAFFDKRPPSWRD